MILTVGVLALQGAFLEHLKLLRKAADEIVTARLWEEHTQEFSFVEVRTELQLSLCDALVIPGGESTTISLVAAQSDLLEPLRDFVKYCPQPKSKYLLIIRVSGFIVSRLGEHVLD